MRNEIILFCSLVCIYSAVVLFYKFFWQNRPLHVDRHRHHFCQHRSLDPGGRLWHGADLRQRALRLYIFGH